MAQGLTGIPKWTTIREEWVRQREGEREVTSLSSFPSASSIVCEFPASSWEHTIEILHEGTSFSYLYGTKASARVSGLVSSIASARKVEEQAEKMVQASASFHSSFSPSHSPENDWTDLTEMLFFSSHISLRLRPALAFDPRSSVLGARSGARRGPRQCVANHKGRVARISERRRRPMSPRQRENVNGDRRVESPFGRNTTMAAGYFSFPGRHQRKK